MGVRLGQHFEGAGEQRVPGQDRGRLVEGLVAGGFATAHVVIVHRGQIVMHQRVGVQHLDAGGNAGGAAAIDTEQGGGLHHDEGAHALAAAKHGVSHGFHHTRLSALRHRQQIVERLFHLVGGGGEGFFER